MFLAMQLWMKRNPENLSKITSQSSESRGQTEGIQYFITNESNMVLL